MDVEKFAKLSIKHFKEVNCYSEVGFTKLEEVFLKYFEDMYYKEMEKMGLEMDLDRKNGHNWSSEQIDERMEYINKKFSNLIKELILSNREDCPF